MRLRAGLRPAAAWLLLSATCASAASSCVAPGFKHREDGTAGLGGDAGGPSDDSGGSMGSGGDASGGNTSSGGSPGTGGSGTGGSGGGAEPSVIGVVGEPCTPNGDYACAGLDQRIQLLCAGGEWESFGQCASDERCDTRASNAGLCESILTECVDLEPGDGVPSCDGNSPEVCGVDRVTLDPGEECPGGEGCLDGECEPVLAECMGKSEGDPVCSADATEAFACGENLVEKEGGGVCGRWCSGGACVDPPSCNGLATLCGSTDEDCCQSPLVAGGDIFRGTDTDYLATVSDFRLDKYEVTVGRFKKFAAAWDDDWRPEAGAGKHTHLNGGDGLVASTGGYEPGWDTAWETNVNTSSTARNVLSGYSTWSSSPDDPRPVNFVNWYEGYAFCTWDGGFLPSEAEWEYAAAFGPAPEGERTYPWGEPAPTISLAVHDCLAAGGQADDCVNADMLEVGSAPGGDGLFGQSDLAGSMWEWTLDRYQAALVVPCEDCVNTADIASSVRRGGGWDSDPFQLEGAFRYDDVSIERDLDSGFRCARAP